MKKMVVFVGLLFCAICAFAQTPRYTTERMADGTLGIICPSEEDALLLLNDNFNLPTRFILAVLLRGLYMEDLDVPFPDPEGKMPRYALRGSRLVDAERRGYPKGLGGASRNFYSLNRATEYYVMWEVALVYPGTILENRTSMVIAIAEKNFNPLTPVRR